MKVVIAGAGGFVGQQLIDKLSRDHEIIALGRQSVERSVMRSRTEWRSCDLFSLLQAEQGVDGADVGVYLVQSLKPSVRLNQGGFEDFDLILADNFARACRTKGIRQIIFLSGILPEPEQGASRYLQSRREVESVFDRCLVPVTILRTSIVLGAQGSSFHVMVRLVRRLPILFCSQWMRSSIQPVAVEDVVDAIRECVGCKEHFSKTYDVAGPQMISSADMMKVIAKLLGLRRFFLDGFWIPVRWSQYWVSTVAGAPKALVAPLIGALHYPMVARPGRLFPLSRDYRGFERALSEALTGFEPNKTPRFFRRSRPKGSEVRSVQRLPLPKGWTALDVSAAYLKWLPTVSPWIVTVDVDGHWVYFRLRWLKTKLLVLEWSPERSQIDRQLLYVRGGLLARNKTRARLEFRETVDGEHVLAAIHNFVPRLPWFLYRWSQALIHLTTMRLFGRYLKKVKKKPKA